MRQEGGNNLVVTAVNHSWQLLIQASFKDYSDLRSNDAGRDGDDIPLPTGYIALHDRECSDTLTVPLLDGTSGIGAYRSLIRHSSQFAGRN